MSKRKHRHCLVWKIRGGATVIWCPHCGSELEAWPRKTGDAERAKASQSAHRAMRCWRGPSIEEALAKHGLMEG